MNIHSIHASFKSDCGNLGALGPSHRLLDSSMPFDSTDDPKVSPDPKRHTNNLVSDGPNYIILACHLEFVLSKVFAMSFTPAVYLKRPPQILLHLRLYLPNYSHHRPA